MLLIMNCCKLFLSYQERSMLLSHRKCLFTFRLKGELNILFLLNRRSTPLMQGRTRSYLYTYIEELITMAINYDLIAVPKIKPNKRTNLKRQELQQTWEWDHLTVACQWNIYNQEASKYFISNIFPINPYAV